MRYDVNQTPEQAARDKIDERLRACGWHVQDKDALDLNAGLGVAVREYQASIAPADYVPKGGQRNPIFSACCLVEKLDAVDTLETEIDASLPRPLCHSILNKTFSRHASRPL